MVKYWKYWKQKPKTNKYVVGSVHVTSLAAKTQLSKSLCYAYSRLTHRFWINFETLVDLIETVEKIMTMICKIDLVHRQSYI